MNTAQPATFVSAESGAFCYLEKSSPHTSNLKFLTYGIYELMAAIRTGELGHPTEETLLFCWQGGVTVRVGGAAFLLEPYDVLYVPRGAVYHLEQSGGESRVIVCRAPAAAAHPVFHAKWKEFSQDEKRIRHLKGKDVIIMFDVTEPSDKLVAGFTLFQPRQRSWPPHRHTDQEEIYIFTKGRGAMSVFADEETKTFVRSVKEGDAVTIPVLNYHPVFSQEEELHFAWCIAGERYWVGDKNKEFLDGNADRLTI